MYDEGKNAFWKCLVRRRSTPPIRPADGLGAFLSAGGMDNRSVDCTEDRKDDD